MASGTNWMRNREGMGLWEHRGKVAVVGWGQSHIDRRWDGVTLDRSCGGLTKEACLKALGTGWAQGLTFRQVEVRTGPGGRPEIHLTADAAARARSLGVRAIHVSLTHQPGLAAAVVVLER